MSEMSGDEVFLFVVASLIAAGWMLGQLFTPKHRIHFRLAEGAGWVRLAVAASLAWVVYVLYHHADPSVVGIYRLFYVVLGLAVLAVFGQGGAGRTGMRYGVDVLERGNPAAGLLVASFILATGLIFGGSLWGEADPHSDYEGGWWIPLGFFLAGWISLLFAAWIYRHRDTGGLVRRMRQIRDPHMVLGFCLYLLSSGWILAESVAGDFEGWTSGLAVVGAVGGMLVTHEVLGLIFQRGTDPRPRAMRGVEAVLYVAWSVGYTLFSRYVLPRWGLPV